MRLRARRDSVAGERLAYRERPEPHFLRAVRGHAAHSEPARLERRLAA